MMLSVDSKYIRLLSFRLRNFKQKNDYLWNFSCPICGDSKKNKLKARGYVFKKGNDLFYTCHNCGVGLSLGNLIKHVDDNTHKEYTLERYTSGKSNNSKIANTTFNITPPKFDKVEKQKVFEQGEWIDRLPVGHFCLDYIKSRKIPEKHYKLLDRLALVPCSQMDKRIHPKRVHSFRLLSMSYCHAHKSQNWQVLIHPE